MSENGGAQGVENQDGTGNGDENGQQHEQAFTQADVDRIVADRLKRERDKITSKYADYDELRQKAEGAKTAEERIAELEQAYKAEQTARLRSDIAAKHGISVEDRDLFLTGADEDTLTKQAERLAERIADRESERKKNRAPLQGRTPSNPADNDRREFLRQLTGQG